MVRTCSAGFEDRFRGRQPQSPCRAGHQHDSVVHGELWHPLRRAHERCGLRVVFAVRGVFGRCCWWSAAADHRVAFWWVGQLVGVFTETQSGCCEWPALENCGGAWEAA